MLNKETRQELKRLIGLINYYDKLLVAVVKKNRYESANHFDQDYEFACDSLNRYTDDFNELTQKIFYRNLDKSVQSSVNYYRKKGGLKPYPKTATL